MTNVTMKSDSFESATDTAAHLFDNWFDPIESGLRERVREFIEALICGELDAALARPRYGRAVNSHPNPTPFSRPIMTPYRRANVPSEGAETGGAEPHIAEQSRSWRARLGAREITRGS